MVDKVGVRRAYDAIAEAYAAARSADAKDVRILAGVLEHVREDGLVLDAGCGHGTPALSRIEHVATGVGLDMSREQLRLAARRVRPGYLVQGDMVRLPFASNAFDAVVALWSLIHVPKTEQPGVIEEFARVLRAGGWILVCDGTHEWAGSNPDWLDTGVRMEWDIAGAGRTAEDLRGVGFAIEDRWGVPELLEAEDGDADGADWTFIAARLTR